VEAEYEAESDASVCGDIDRTGVRDLNEVGSSGLVDLRMKSRTSL
jgi:hypothetical protein